MITSIVRIVVLSFLTLALGPLAVGSARADSGSTRPIPELDGFSPSPIVIEADGSCTDAEWPAGSAVLPLTFSSATAPAGVSATGKLVIRHPDDPIVDQSLYLYVHVTDNSSELSGALQDSLVVLFDLGNAHTAAGATYAASGVRGVRVQRGGNAVRVFGNITSPSSEGTAIDPARVCVKDTDDTDWIVELELRPSDLGRSDFKVFSAAAVRAVNINGGSAANSDWPSAGAANMNNWDHLVSRPPVDYVMVIDQSGSMSGAKWSSVKLAGNHLRAMLVTLDDSTLGDPATGAFHLAGLTGAGDRVGLATFSTGIAGNATTNRNLERVAVAPLDYTSVLPAQPSGGTPIAAGVERAVTMFGGAIGVDDSAHASLNVVRKKIVVLLSDGMHNSPSTSIDFDPPSSDLSYLPVAACDTAAAHSSFVHLYPVAIGTDSSVDTLKLASLRNCYRGPNVYNIAPTQGDQLTADLTTFFFTALLPYYQLNMLFGPSAPTGGEFVVRPGDRNLVLFAFWPTGTASKALSVTDGASAVVNGTCPAGTDYCFIKQPVPVAGTYTAFTAAGAIAQYGVLDLDLEARFALDNQPHGTSSTVTLRARLEDDGAPLVGASVRVDVARPTEGFGSVASTSALSGCKRVVPEAPSVRVPTTDNGTFGQPVFSSPNLGLQPKPVNGDVKPPAYALMESLLAACGKQDLARTDENGLSLFDDGTHGDATANDGLYTLTFTNTTIEGSYAFRFRASGKDSLGRNFERVQQISEYVRLDVDPATTSTGSTVLATSGNLVMQLHSVVPRDKHGGYLGPGQGAQVRFAISGATAVGGVRDFNNGMYGQVLTYDKTKGTPGVGVVVQGVPIGPPGAPPCKDAPFPWALVIFLILLALILLVLLLLCYRHRRREAR